MFSKSCKYAIKACIYIAQYREGEAYVGAKDIARGINAPEHFVAKILQILSRKKIINSTKGTNGGFCMNELQMNAPIIEIVNLIDGEDLLSGCVLGLEYCSNANPCPMHNEFQFVKKSIRNMIEKNTIMDFRNMVNEKKSVLFLD
jgi:Rrf2 family protein